MITAHRSEEKPGQHILYRDPYVFITRVDTGPDSYILGATIINDRPEKAIGAIQMDANFDGKNGLQFFKAYVLTRRGHRPPSPIKSSREDGHATDYTPLSYLPGHDEFLESAGQKPLGKSKYLAVQGRRDITASEQLLPVTEALVRKWEISPSVHNALTDIAALFTGDTINSPTKQEEVMKSLAKHFANSPDPADTYKDPDIFRYRVTAMGKYKAAALVLNSESPPDCPVSAVGITALDNGIHVSLIPRGDSEPRLNHYEVIEKSLRDMPHQHSFLYNSGAKNFLQTHNCCLPRGDKIIDFSGADAKQALEALSKRGLISIKCEIKCRNCIDQLQKSFPDMPLGWEHSSPIKPR